MKHIKILSLLLALVMLLAFAGCDVAPQKAETKAPAETAKTAETNEAVETAAAETDVTVLIETADGIKTVGINLADLAEGATMLDAFKADAYKAYFGADFTEGEYVMVNSLEGLIPDASKNEYIAIYSTDTKTNGIVDVESEYTTKVEYEGVTFYSTMVGVADLTLAAGESYLFQIATW